MESLILEGKALERKIIEKISSKHISLTIMETNLMLTLLGDKCSRIPDLSEHGREEVGQNWGLMREHLQDYTRKGFKKICAILRDLVQKNLDKFIKFPWDDESTGIVLVPNKQMEDIAGAYDQMHKALNQNLDSQSVKRVFKDLLVELEELLIPKLEGYAYKSSSVAVERLKDQLEWLLGSLKKTYIKSELTLGETEVKIKELIYSKFLTK